MINSLTNFTLRPMAPAMRKVFMTSAALMALGLAGCSGAISGAGPYKGAIEKETNTYNLIDINASTIAPFMRVAQKPARFKVVSTVPGEVRLMGGDVINVLIADNARKAVACSPLSSAGVHNSRFGLITKASFLCPMWDKSLSLG